MGQVPELAVISTTAVDAVDESMMQAPVASKVNAPTPLPPDADIMWVEP
jgi:hypothetical protein